MKVTTELKSGFGIIFDRHTPVCMEDGARKLFALLDLCHHDYKVSTYAQLSATLEEGETLATLKACDIYEILNCDNYAHVLATILKEVIKEQEGIDLTVSDDFNDSDNVVLAIETEKMPLGLAVNAFKDLVSIALRKYMGMLWTTVPYPCYVSWAEKVPAPAPSKEFFVDTPLGKIKVSAKGATNDYPGIYVDLVAENGDETPLACVEYDENEHTVAVDIYHKGCHQRLPRNLCGSCCQNGDETPLACVEYDENEHTVAVDIYHDGENPNMVERTYCHDHPGADLVEAKQVINEFVKEAYKSEGANFSDLNKVPIAWTEYEEEGYAVNVYADLVNFALHTDVTPFGGEPVRVSSFKYDTLQDLIDEQLEFLDFSNYTSITDGEWTAFGKNPSAQKWLAGKFPVGTRILIPNYGDGEDQRGEIVQQPKSDCWWFIAKMDNGKEVALVFGVDEFGIDGTDFPRKEGAA